MSLPPKPVAKKTTEPAKPVAPAPAAKPAAPVPAAKPATPAAKPAAPVVKKTEEKKK